MNKVITGIDRSRSYRVYLAVTTSMAEDARKVHQTAPTATAALGRVLTAAGLMGLMMKGDKDKLTLQFKGDGDAVEILATSNAKGDVKGYIVNPDADPPLKANGKLDVGTALGIGMIVVIKDLGMKEPYIGKIDLVSGEIADDLTAYFFISEQQSTSVALGEIINIDGTVKAAGGMIIQMLPDGKEEAVDVLEDLVHDMEPISALVDEVTLASAGKTDKAIMEDLLNRVFRDVPEEFKVDTLELLDLRWHCDCSLERLEQVVISIGKKDLARIIDEDGEAELVCQFCGTKYHFDKDHLMRLLLESAKKKSE
jgi:molecular chaperone Hsp33